MSLVVEDVHFFRIEEQSAIDIPYKGIIGKGVPEPGDDIVELPRPAITLGVIRLFVAAKIPRRIRV